MKKFKNGRSKNQKKTARSSPAIAMLVAYDRIEPRAMMADLNLPQVLSTFAESDWGHHHDSDVFERIINGTVTSQFPSVGLVGDSSGAFCSGTLIAPQYVLTAGHCAEGVGNTAGRFVLGSKIFSTSQVFVHPGYNSNLIGSDSANDIAIYKLNQPVTGITPSPIYRAVPSVGQLLTLVGFGAGGNGNTGQDGTFGTKRMGTTPIDGVTSKLIHWNFGNNSESNTAPGDSGGPAFVLVNGTYFVAGVTSGGDNANAALGDHSFDTRVDAFVGWIDSIVGSGTSPITVSIHATDALAGETLSSQTANTGTFVVSRTGSTTAPLTVNLSRGGTAINGTDYNLLSTTVTIPAGASSTSIVLAPKDDALAEGTESATCRITAGTGYSINSTNNLATISIADNDQIIWNNLFANRREIVGGYAVVTGNNVGATRESGEPNVAQVSGGKSVWWTWTPSLGGTVTFTTAGSNYDTTLGVYKGNAVNNLTLVKSNDDENYSQNILTSKVVFNAVAGQTYQILVDGYDGSAGAIKLTVDQPAGRSAKLISVFAGERNHRWNAQDSFVDWRHSRIQLVDSAFEWNRNGIRAPSGQSTADRLRTDRRIHRDESQTALGNRSQVRSLTIDDCLVNGFFEMFDE